VNLDMIDPGRRGALELIETHSPTRIRRHMRTELDMGSRIIKEPQAPALMRGISPIGAALTGHEAVFGLFKFGLGRDAKPDALAGRRPVALLQDEAVVTALLNAA
jgi:hypothetical protein